MIHARSITFSVAALIRRNDRRGDNSWQEICRFESRRNCINLSSLSRAAIDGIAALSRRLNLPSRTQPGSALLSITSISFRTPPWNLPRWRLEPYGFAALLEDAERRPMGWLLLSCHFRLSGRRHRHISLCSSLLRLLNYIPINNALPACLPTLSPASLFTVPSAAPREDFPSPGSRQIVAFVISTRFRFEIPAKGSFRHFAFPTNE